MKTILATLLTFLLLLPVSAFGEIQTITHTVKQPFGGSQSPDDARISAVAKAKREALETAGTYIESLTVVKNNQVDKDEILALAAGVLKAEVVSQNNYVIGEAFGIEIIVNVIVDTSVLEERVKNLLQDRSHLEQLKQAEQRERELLQKVASLEKENQHLMKKNQTSKELTKQFKDASRGLEAEDWLNKANSLWDINAGKYIDPEMAIEYLNQATRTRPGVASGYLARGMAYLGLGQYQRAIEDFNQAIRLQPDDARAYNAQGVAYCYWGQYKNAREAFDEAIRLKPDDNSAYYNYACTFALQKDATQACNWLGWAIERGYKNWKHLQTDKDFNNIRNEKCFVDIIKKNVKLTDKKKPLAMGKRISVSKTRVIRRDGRFIAYADGTVRDTRTNLMWAAKDWQGAKNYRSNKNWQDAKNYCENYGGGGYTDWRMPTQDELAGLYDANKSRPAPCDHRSNIHVATKLIDITCFWIWSSETNSSGSVAAFSFHLGRWGWNSQKSSYPVLPVRSGR